MSPIFVHRDIEALRLIRDATVQRRGALAERYARLCRELDEKKERNKESRKNLAVIRHRIKDIQKDIFMMNAATSDVDEASVAMLLEVGNKEKQLSALRNQAKGLSDQFETTASAIQQALDDVAELETNCRSISVEVVSLEKEKHDLSESIAKCLEHTSLERKKVEAELNDLSAAFLRVIDERKTIEDRLSERRAACEELSMSMDELTQKISALEAIKPILDRIREMHQDVADLEVEIESRNTTRRTLLKEMNDRQRQFETVTLENSELIAGNADLERDVGLYESVVSEVKMAQALNDQAHVRMNQVADELMAKLIVQTELDRTIREIWRQFDALSDLLTESGS